MTYIRVTHAGDITRIGFDRPQKHNALDAAMVEELHHALDAATTPSILVFHSTTPGMFVAGADISELRNRTAEDALRRINGALFDRIAAHRWPTVAAIDGPALGGGCELALACDFRVASTRSRFAQPELRLGILAAAGGNYRLARIAGLPVARRMLLAGAALTADQALACGLVDIMTEPANVGEAADGLARDITRASWQALELTKRALSLHEQGTADFDAPAQAVLFESEEKRRRMDEFLARQEGRNTR